MGIQHNHCGGHLFTVPEEKFHVVGVMLAYEQGNFILPKKGKYCQKKRYKKTPHLFPLN
jgi:hypothetical protein